MSHNPVEDFLQHAIGLDSASIGVDVLQQMLHAGLRRTNLAVDDYAKFLRQSSEEQTRLIESVVVLETWFFRNNASFAFFAKHLEAYKQQPLRLLSLPCATGEEAYSLAIILLEKAFKPNLLRIDAVDISQQALQTAQRACYRASSFRDEHAEQVKQHFFQTIKPQNALHNEQVYQVKPQLQKLVHWRQGNLLNPHLFTENALFDVIFCRNLLIYLTAEARTVALANLRRWLKPNGLLFIGHAERNLACHAGFTQVLEAGVFACWHPQAPQAQKNTSPPPALGLANLPKTPQFNRLPEAQPASVVQSPPAQQAVEPRLRKTQEVAYQALENAQSFADQGELDKALEYCQRFLREQPDAPQGHFLCALIYQARQDDTQAERYFQQTLYLQPDHKQALHHLHLLLQRQGRLTQAKSLQQRLQRLRGKPRVA